MDQIKIGKFIAACRKEKGLTQKQLAEILGISVNELLSGEKLPMENYQENAEQNLIAMKQIDENMEHKLQVVGRLVMVGYGILGVCVAIIFCYHLYLNYTDINYNGKHFNMLLPLFIVMAFLAVISGLIINFLKKYNIVRK